MTPNLIASTGAAAGGIAANERSARADSAVGADSATPAVFGDWLAIFAALGNPAVDPAAGLQPALLPSVDPGPQHGLMLPVAVDQVPVSGEPLPAGGENLPLDAGLVLASAVAAGLQASGGAALSADSAAVDTGTASTAGAPGLAHARPIAVATDPVPMLADRAPHISSTTLASGRAVPEAGWMASAIPSAAAITQVMAEQTGTSDAPSTAGTSTTPAAIHASGRQSTSETWAVALPASASSPFSIDRAASHRGEGAEAKALLDAVSDGSADAPLTLDGAGRAARATAAGSTASVPTASANAALTLDTAFDEALGQRLLGMAQHGRSEMRLHVHPEHLGALDIRLKMDGDAAQLSLSSPHAVVRDAVEQAVPRLRELLGEAGVDLTQVSVDARAQHERSARDGERRPGASEVADPNSLDDAGQPAQSVRAVASAPGLVDTFA